MGSEPCCFHIYMNSPKYSKLSSEMLALAAQKERLSALSRVPGRLQALVAEKAARKKQVVD